MTSEPSRAACQRALRVLRRIQGPTTGPSLGSRIGELRRLAGMQVLESFVYIYIYIYRICRKSQVAYAGFIYRGKRPRTRVQHIPEKKKNSTEF